MPGPFPVANATVPYWRTEPHELDTYRSTETLPATQDIAIIGAGFAGAAAAYYLLHQSQSTGSTPPRSVTILEAREACSGASGRNGGNLRPSNFVGVAARRRTHGLAAANEVGLFELANAEAVARLVEREGVDCGLRAVTTGDAVTEAAAAAEAKALYDELVGLGCPTMRRVEYYGGEAAERVSGVKEAKALFTMPAHLLWPYKLVMHLLSTAVARGANLQTHTPVEAISETADGEGYWTLRTPRGPLRARQVIFATNAYTGGVLPAYADAIYPVKGTCCRVVPSAAAAAAATGPERLESCGIAWHGLPLAESYYAAQPDGSIVAGGGRSCFRHDKTLWFRRVDDDTLIGPTVPYFAGWAARTFAGGEAGVESMWTGIMGGTPDGAPHVGPVPGKAGQFMCAGFVGHGMPNVLLCAKGVVRMLTEGCPFAETGVPACYETSLERLQDAKRLTEEDA
ncbi:FAD dependent oxidoreductase [Xylariomycetidae sp. FL0641]|nr:FAD dependent oxidoreductase [Xylariomycetidae sp. FL0641]